VKHELNRLPEGKIISMQDVDLGKEACLLLERKLAFFSQYLSVTERMQAALGAKEEGSLGSLIATRQDLIHKIDKIDLAIERTMPPSPDERHLISEQFKELIAGYLGKLKSVMDTVEPLDRDLVVMVQQEGAGIKTDLLQRQKVRQAFKGYGSYGKYPAKFLDTHR